MAKGRRNKTQLIRCVGFLYEAWREALNNFGAFNETETENDEEEEDEALDADAFAKCMTMVCQSLGVVALDDVLEKRAEAPASQQAVRCICTPTPWRRYWSSATAPRSAALDGSSFIGCGPTVTAAAMGCSR